MAVENMRLAVIAAPVTAATGVADRAVQANKPSSALKPRIQTATDGPWAAHQRAWNTTSTAAAGSTSKRMAFDCHLRFTWSTPHPTAVLEEAEQMWFRGQSVYTHLRSANEHLKAVHFFCFRRAS
jgi:hypothetical protein